ncbi:MAG: dihydroorotate dehydrogenase-like protein [Acidimicrobiia bacterium]|nr:dihydroorotate dehydrogenase-like protein [Acidimicrobiia bacterium]
MDLSTRYLGLELASPLVASAGPLTGRLETLARLEDAGAAAVVLPSLFEEEIVEASREVHRVLEAGTESFPEALTYLPEPPSYDTPPDRTLRLVAEAKAALRIPVIASLNGSSRGGWIRYAGELADAGADALELNVYHVAADVETSSADVEARYLDLVTAVRDAVDIPVAVKIPPFFTSTAHTAMVLVKAGADGLVLFNRFYQPDIDLETLEVRHSLDLSTRASLRLPLRWIAILYGRIDASLAASGGVHTSRDVAKVLLAGADVAMSTSALLLRGPELLTELRDGLVAWMEEHDYDSVAQLRGSVSQRAVPDPEAFERASYVRIIRRYTDEWVL